MSKLILGYGLLGKEIHKQTGWDIYKGNHQDVYENGLYDKQFNFDYECIINCFGYTNTYDNDKLKHWGGNVVITKTLIDFCNNYDLKYIHISTDYIYAGSKSFASEEDVPVHNNCWYTYTKLVADALVQLESNDYLICRGTHKPYPFPYDKAWADQVGNFDYVPIIAKLIIKLVEKNAIGVYNVGTGLKTMAELAGNKERILKADYVPGDVTMNLDKLNDFLKE